MLCVVATEEKRISYKIIYSGNCGNNEDYMKNTSKLNPVIEEINNISSSNEVYS